MSFAAFDAPAPLDAQLYTMIELEGTRYGAFFNKLAGGQASISRDQALDFFRKSSLTEEQVHELYARLKGLQLLRQGDRMNESEFVMGMHLIVCMTKRGLTQIPSPFPSYLFPSLDLTPEAAPSFDFPSPTPPSETSKASSDTPLIPDVPLSFTATSPVTTSPPLIDAKSLTELVHLELRAKQHEAEVLAKVDQSETRALQSLHACVERIAQQVDALGFPVPSSSRKIDALDDLRNLLTKHVHAAKQEIQSMQIDAQMRSVASEATQDEGSRQDPLKLASGLTQELMALQHQTAQLMARKADVVARLVAVKSGGSAAGSFIQQSGSQSFEDSKNPSFALSKGALTVGELGTASASTTPPKHAEGYPEPSLMQSHNSASSGGWGTFGAGTPQDPPPPQPFGVKIEAPAASNDPFAFGSAPAAVGAGAPKKSESTQDSDFAWGSFQ